MAAMMQEVYDLSRIRGELERLIGEGEPPVMPGGGGGDDSKWVQIEESESFAPNRWDYTGFTLSGDQQTVDLRNGMEDPNTGTGVEGNGVNMDTLPDGFGMVPIGVGAVVRAWPPDEPGDPWKFSVANAIDGECLE